MDIQDSQGLKLVNLEPYGAKSAQDLFGSTSAEQLDPGEASCFQPGQGMVSIQAAFTGESQIGTDAIAGTTRTTTAISAGDSITGYVNTLKDHDWFRIQLTAGTTYVFNLNRVASTTGLVDPLLALRNSTGGLITQNDDIAGSQNSEIIYTATRSGTFYLDAGAYADSLTGQYQLLAARRVSDQFSANTNTTGSISAGGSVRSTIDSRGDHDWFKIQLTAGKNYVFNLNKVGGTGLADPLLNLRNSTGTIISTNDDANGTVNSQITFNATTTGTYFLDAGAYAEGSTGQYQLSATETAPVSPGYSATTGYGEASVKRALENLLNISIPNVADLGGIFWGLDRLGAPEVWSAGYTGSGITVAVIDTGVDYTHSDLAGNIWINSGEIAGNGIDDDGNGFIDDVRGWNFSANNNNVMDDNSHGTHVAGTIAGGNNGTGITGVAYNAKIMAVKVLNGSGSGTLSGVANGIRYAANNGAKVINLSLGGGGSAELLDAVSYATSRGAVVVMAAGNEAAARPSYPGSYAQYYGLTVGAVDSSGTLASFSNRAGSTTLDYVTAAGVNVYSSVPGNGYASYSGTSMATPHIAGAMALLQQANIQNNKGLSVAQLETLLTSTASNQITAGAQSTTTSTSSARRTTTSIGTPVPNATERRKAFEREEEDAVGRMKTVSGSLAFLETGLWQTFSSRSGLTSASPGAKGTPTRSQAGLGGLNSGSQASGVAGASLASQGRSITETIVSTTLGLLDGRRASGSASDPLTGLLGNLTTSLSPWSSGRS